jgi:hypothetical protein
MSLDLYKDRPGFCDNEAYEGPTSVTDQEAFEEYLEKKWEDAVKKGEADEAGPGGDQGACRGSSEALEAGDQSDCD